MTPTVVRPPYQYEQGKPLHAGRAWLRRQATGAGFQYRDAGAAERGGDARHVGVPCHRSPVLRRPGRRLFQLSHLVRRRVHRRGADDQGRARHHQHRRPPDQQRLHGDGGDHLRSGRRRAPVAVACGNGGARRRLHRHQGLRILARISGASGSGAELRPGAARRRRRDLLHVLLLRDRPPRASPADRHQPGDLAGVRGSAAAASTAADRRPG